MTRTATSFLCVWVLSGCGSSDSADLVKSKPKDAGFDADDASVVEDAGELVDVEVIDGGSVSDAAPVTPPPGVWTYYGVPGTQCLNGNEAGFGIITNPASHDLMIYLVSWPDAASVRRGAVAHGAALADVLHDRRERRAGHKLGWQRDRRPGAARRALITTSSRKSADSLRFRTGHSCSRISSCTPRGTRPRTSRTNLRCPSGRTFASWQWARIGGH